MDHCTLIVSKTGISNRLNKVVTEPCLFIKRIPCQLDQIPNIQDMLHGKLIFWYQTIKKHNYCIWSFYKPNTFCDLHTSLITCHLMNYTNIRYSMDDNELFPIHVCNCSWLSINILSELFIKSSNSITSSIWNDHTLYDKNSLFIKLITIVTIIMLRFLTA